MKKRRIERKRKLINITEVPVGAIYKVGVDGDTKRIIWSSSISENRMAGVWQETQNDPEVTCCSVSPDDIAHDSTIRDGKDYTWVWVWPHEQAMCPVPWKTFEVWEDNGEYVLYSDVMPTCKFGQFRECDGCGLMAPDWWTDERCPNHAHPLKSCDGILRNIKA